MEQGNGMEPGGSTPAGTFVPPSAAHAKSSEALIYTLQKKNINNTNIVLDAIHNGATIATE